MIALTRTFVILILLLSPTLINAQTSWEGEYTLGELNDRVAQGPEIYVPVRIKITSENGKLTAHLFGKSGNIAIDIYADAVEAGNKINLVYRNLGNYHTWRKFDKKDLLVSLERTDSTSKNNILTYWGEFSPITEDRIESGKPYFKKISKEAAKWVKIETNDKRLSLLFLKDFLVNRYHLTNLEKNDRAPKAFQIFGFGEGLRMHFIFFEKKTPFKSINFGNRSKVLKFREFIFNDYQVAWRSLKRTEDQNAEEFLFASKKNVFILSVWGDKLNRDAILTFVSGIRIDGKPFIRNPKSLPTIAEQFNISKLKSSSKVVEAHDRKPKKPSRKITYEPFQDRVYGDSSALFSHDPLIIQYGYFKGGYPNGFDKGKKVLIKFQMLANGNIGDMTVYTSGNKKLARTCIKIVENIRFVPAMVRGKPVNSLQVHGCGAVFKSIF